MSAGPSRSRVTRVELTADQLLGADLTPARPYKPPKHAPKVITVEQLLGPSLTIAPAARGGSSSSSAASSHSSRSAVRSPARPHPAPSPSPHRVPAAPNRTADEVLRTGLPMRTLQAAKQRARSGQALVLTAEQLLGSSSGSSGSRSPRLTADSTHRPNTAGASAASPSPGRSRSGRVARPSTAGATPGGDGSSNAARGRESRPRQARRSSSLGSTHTLPIYTKEPGESEVVIDRGTEDLEDEIPITVMTPVEEDGPSLANGVPNSIPSPPPPANPGITQHLSPAASPTVSNFALNPAQSCVISLISATSPIPISPAGRMSPSPGARPMPYPDEVPSYEAVMSMSTPDLHGPASPALSALGSPRALSPSTGTPSTPASPDSRPGSSSPPSPTNGAESPRRRFGLMSLFHAHSHSHSQERSTRNRGGSVSGLPSQTPGQGNAASDRLSPGPSASVECPRPRLRSSGSLLDLLSRSWSDNHMARSRSDRGPGGT